MRAIDDGRHAARHVQITGTTKRIESLTIDHDPRLTFCLVPSAAELLIAVHSVGRIRTPEFFGAIEKLVELTRFEPCHKIDMMLAVDIPGGAVVGRSLVLAFGRHDERRNERSLRGL